MLNEQPRSTSLLSNRLPMLCSALTLVCALMVLGVAAQAQTFTVLHNFTGGQDGATPKAGITLDQAGNLYGTTAKGASFAGNCSVLGGCGTVFELKRENSGWLFNPLYTFHFSDGASPLARVVFGPEGLLYGTANQGANVNQFCGITLGCGVVFSLRPPATFCRSVPCSWTETVLYKFTGGFDGFAPCFGDLVFDPSGNLYGTNAGGANGVVYELSPSGNGWTFNSLYDFSLGQFFYTTEAAGVILDPAGNLYGAVQSGGLYGGGAAYELTPSSPHWTFTDLHANTGGSDGGLIRDSSGNLYGTTLKGGANGGGIVYELSPSNGGWTFTTLYSFSGGGGSYAVLTMDTAGNLYGTTTLDGAYKQGNVFKLTPSNGSWTYTSLHDFTGGEDGARPLGQVTLDASGNLYGTAPGGGTNNKGVVWEIMP
jgi:uncharacterized repeat protein (TIGR03803 family)